MEKEARICQEKFGQARKLPWLTTFCLDKLGNFGICSLNMKQIRLSKQLGAIILATRPWSFSMTAISVTLGSMLAVPAVAFHWGDYGLVLAGMVLVHAATNVFNDYCDFQAGVDAPGSPTTLYRRHPLVEGDFTPGFILGLSLACYAAAALIGGYFFLTQGWFIALFAVIGGLASIFYTAGPVKYKYRALGEVMAFVMWGPLMLTACYFIQTQSWTQIGSVWLVSIPQGLWVALVLLANNLTDTEYDRETGVQTLGTLFGRQKTIRLFVAVVAAIYCITGLEILVGVISPWGLLTLLALPIIGRFIFLVKRAPAIPVDADPQTAKAAMIYGIALIGSFLLARVF